MPEVADLWVNLRAMTAQYKAAMAEATAEGERFAAANAAAERSSTRAGAATTAAGGRARRAAADAEALSGSTRRAAQDTERLGARATRTSSFVGALGNEARRSAGHAGVLQGSVLRLTSAMTGGSSTAAGFVSKLRSIGPATAAIGVGVAAVSMKMAGDFQQQTNVLVTAAGETKQNLATVRDGILSIARATGSTWQNLTEGMYQVEKAGFRGADGLKVLRAAAQGAREEGASLSSVTDAMTTVMNNYGLKGKDSVRVMNAMKTAAGEGKMTMEQFASSLATVAGQANANKVPFYDIAGAEATLTQRGETARHATQLLNGTIRALASPNSVAISTLNQLGLSSVKVAQDLGRKGLTGTLNEISDAIARKMGPSGLVAVGVLKQSASAAQDANLMLSKMPPSLRSAAQAFDQGNMSAGDFRKTYKGLGADGSAMGAQFEGLEKKSKGFSDQVKAGNPAFTTYADLLKKATGGQMGLQTATLLSGSAAGHTADAVEKVKKSWDDNSKSVEGWDSTQKLFNVQLDIFKQHIETAAVSFGMKLLPVASKFFSFLETHKTLAKTIAIGIGAIALALGVASVAMLAFEVASSPVGLIAAALALVAVGMVYLWNKSQTFREVLTNVFVTVALPVLEFAKIAIGVFSLILQSFLSFAASMLHVASNAFSWIPGIGPKIQKASNAVQSFSDGAGKMFDGMTKKIGGWQDSLAKLPDKIKVEGDIKDLEKKLGKVKDEMSAKNLPPEKLVKLTADKTDLEQKLLQKKLDIAASPKEQKTLLTAQIDQWTKDIAAAKKNLSSVPKSQQAKLTADISQLVRARQQAADELAKLHNKTVSVDVHTTYSFSGSRAKAALATGGMWSGGIRRMASGGFGRPAMMSRGGTGILWAEGPDESYIPHTRTPRSRAIAEQTVGILGGSVSWGGQGDGTAGVASLGRNVAQGLWQGMQGQAGWLAGQVRAWALKTVPTPIADALGIHSPSRVAAALGRWVGHGMVQGLTGSTASVKSATLKLARSIEQVFHDDAKRQIEADKRKLRNLAGVKGTRAARERADIRADLRQQQHILNADSSISKLVAKDNAKLLSLASQRDTVAKKLKAAQQHLADLRKSWTDKKNEIASGIMSGVSVLTTGEDGGRPVNAQDVLTHLREQAQKAIAFAGLLKQLKSKGLRSDLIQQLAAAGPEQGYDTALALAGGTGDQIRQVNSTQKSLVDAANSTGTVVADAMYGAGIKSAEGLVKGLASQEKAIEAQMMRIAKSMEKAIKRALGIHSPSRVMAELGDYTAQGLAVGIDRSAKHARIAAHGMAMSVSQAARVTASTGRLAVSSNLAATAGAGGGQHVEVHVHVAGSVLSEKELRDVVEKQMLRLGMRNSRTYSSYQR